MNFAKFFAEKYTFMTMTNANPKPSPLLLTAVEAAREGGISEDEIEDTQDDAEDAFEGEPIEGFHNRATCATCACPGEKRYNALWRPRRPVPCGLTRRSNTICPEPAPILDGTACYAC